MRLVCCLAGLWAAVCVLAGPSVADGKNIILVADERLEASGLLRYIVPRFALKNGIRVNVSTADAGNLANRADQADALLGPETIAEALQAEGVGHSLRPAFYVDGRAADETYAVVLIGDGENSPFARTFSDWLTSKIGQRTIASYSPPGQPAYLPGALKVAPDVAELPEGDIDEGEKLAHLHCGRCHVVSDKNPFGGIGSTPSFPALRAIPSWRKKLSAFWTANPHLSFMRIEDISPPFDPDHPPHVAPVVLTQSEMEAIIAFVATIKPKDLGAAIRTR